MTRTAVDNKPVGRPPVFSDKAVLGVNSATAKAKLQANSDRRAIVNRIIEAGGKASLEELNAHFGFNVRAAVTSLINAGWIFVESEK